MKMKRGELVEGASIKVLLVRKNLETILVYA